MNEKNQTTLSKIEGKFNVTSSKEYAGELTVEVEKEDILELAKFLHDDEDLNYDYIVDISAVDFPKKEKRFMLVYHFFSIPRRHRIRIKTWLAVDELLVESVTSVWRGAEFMEDEVFDMMGIRFENHPNLRRILMTEDFDGYPLRKDYPLKGRGWRHDFTSFMPDTEERRPSVPEENSFWRL